MIWRLAKDIDLPIWASQGPKIENEALKDNVFSSLRWMKIQDDMNKISMTHSDSLSFTSLGISKL